MKVYYVRVTDSEFTKTGDVWTSPIVDLYANSTYKNYSSTKSAYGLNLLADNTWTGMELLSPGVTDSGFIDAGRFVDTTGRIDVISPVLTTDPGIGGLVEFSLDVCTTGSLAAMPTWAMPVTGVQLGQDINLIDSDRYAYFRLTFTNPRLIVFSAELLVRIEIDQPVIAPLYRRSRIVLDKYPEWMAIRELEYQPATPELATPNTLGSAFINAAGGQWLEQLANDLTTLDLQHYIGTVDLNQVAWVYKRSGLDIEVWDVQGDGVHLTRSFDLEEFYAAFEDEDIYFWEEGTRTVYTRLYYNLLAINGVAEATPSTMETYHVWNWIDDLGLLVDLERLHLETNSNYSLRILDVHKNRPGVGVESFKLALRRELNIWSAYGATPDSDYLGATPTLLEMVDIEQDAQYVTPEGMATTRFVKLVAFLAETYPTTWGFFYWNRAFWDFGGAKHEGYGLLPQRFDATPLSGADTQPGVGHAADMFVYRPDVVAGPHQFDATLKVRGRHRTWRTEYPSVGFDVQVWGRADKVIYTNPELDVLLTLELTLNDATPGTTYVYSFHLTATSDANITNPTGTSASHAALEIFDYDGFTRLDWRTYDNVQRMEQPTPTYIHVEDVASIRLSNGGFDFDTATLIDDTVADVFEAWLSPYPAVVLDNTSGPITETANVLQQPYVVLKSKSISSATGKWESEKQVFHVMLNGGIPDNTPQSFRLPFPPIAWDPNLAVVPNKEYVVQNITLSQEATPQYGAYTLDDNDATFFLPDTYM